MHSVEFKICCLVKNIQFWSIYDTKVRQALNLLISVPFLSKYGRMGHLLITYLLPVLVYLPTGLFVHLYLYMGYNFTAEDTSEEFSFYAMIFGAIYLGAPIVYMILALIYYRVSLCPDIIENYFFKGFFLLEISQLVWIYCDQEFRYWNECFWRRQC